MRRRPARRSRAKRSSPWRDMHRNLDQRVVIEAATYGEVVYTEHQQRLVFAEHMAADVKKYVEASLKRQGPWLQMMATAFARAWRALRDLTATATEDAQANILAATRDCSKCKAHMETGGEPFQAGVATDWSTHSRNLRRRASYPPIRRSFGGRRPVRSERTRGELARYFEPMEQSISACVIWAKRDSGGLAGGPTSAEQDGLTRQRGENRRLSRERKIPAEVARARRAAPRAARSAIFWKQCIMRRGTSTPIGAGND